MTSSSSSAGGERAWRPEEEVVAAARRRSAALVAGDRAAMEACLDPAFTYGNAGGAQLAREAYVAGYVGVASMRWSRQDLEDVVVRVVGGVAVLTCRTHDVAVFDGVAFDGWFRSLHVWVRRGEGWRCLAIQTTAAGA